MFNIPVKGTHAHAYITSFSGFAELSIRNLRHKTTGGLLPPRLEKPKLISTLSPGVVRDLLELAVEHRTRLSSLMKVSTEESSDSELAAMVSFAIAFPDGFMALVDTYDVKR